MIIKGLFKRYERWNPVHPTLGTFWGMGIGVGCGVGWGPGFGPEVIGYVGAGCGAGFCIGITLVGVGIGLPQNGPIIKASQSAYAATNVYLESARALGVAILNGMVWDNLNMISPQIDSLRKQSSQHLSRFRENAIRATKKIEFTNLNKALSGSMQSSLDCMRAFRDQQCENAIRATKNIEFTNLNKALSGSIQSSLECLRAFRDQHWPPPNGK